MTLREKINIGLKEAMKVRNETAVDTLRAIRSEIIKFDKSGLNREMTEEDEIRILNQQVKMRKEAIEMFEKAGRTDLVERERAQLNVIQKYLPEQISKDEAEKIIDGIISGIKNVSEKDFGRVMGVVMKELKGKIDGKVIQEIVRKKLTK